MTDIAPLIHRYLKEELSDQESRQLEEWKMQSDVNRQIFENLTDDSYLMQAIIDSYKIDTDEAALRKINMLIDAREARIKFIRKWVSIAAACVFVVYLTSILILKIDRSRVNVIAYTNTAKTDISAGTYGARLTLSNGETITIDSAGNSAVAIQGTTNILNKEGKLVYDGNKNSEVLFNTLSTSKGQMYPVVLSDHSRVWLNNASSLRFPVSFVTKERKVELTGEGYFEIAYDHSKPFIVVIEGIEIQVLGTKFNVNSYKDESALKTTLLEGSVIIKNGAHSVKMKPLQQAQVTGNTINLTSNVNVEKVVAWRNGFFSFKDDKLSDVMREISRWYDVEVVYESDIRNIEFSGDIHRKSNLSEVIRILSLLKIQARIEGRKLILKEQ